MSETTVDGAEAQAEEPVVVTPEDMISRGKGMSPAAIAELPDDSPVKAALEDFKDLVARYKEAEDGLAKLVDERNQAIYALKNEHNVGFSAMAELLGVTSSMVLYLHERAQGKSAKQIREESVKSRLAKEQFQEKGEGKSARKQTPEEKAFRKQQREALQQFLASQKADGADVEPLGDDDE